MRLIEESLRFGRKGFARIVELTPSRLNFSWITEQLAVGGVIPPRHYWRLRQRGIGAVVDCRAEDCDDEHALRSHGIELLHLPAPDTREIDQASIDRGVVWVAERIERNVSVYVHCLHGVGRGPLLGCCVLIAAGHTPSEALRRIKTGRWQASPNEEQLRAVWTWAERRSLQAPSSDSS
jgi:hypothetical protein